MQQDNLLLTKSDYQKLSESLRAELDMYLKSCEKKKNDCLFNHQNGRKTRISLLEYQLIFISNEIPSS